MTLKPMTTANHYTPAFAAEGLVDIGLNLSNQRFNDDCQQVLERAKLAGVEHCIITGTSVADSIKAIELCQQYHSLFPAMLSATVGVHPHEASHVNDAVIEQLHGLIHQNRQWVVAVGETGLDFCRNFSPPKAQIAAFEHHITMAQQCQLPLFLHDRDAYKTQTALLKKQHLPNSGVIHCFTGNREALDSYLAMDFYVGITGWVCDERRGTELQQLVKDIPLNRLLVETDAPYLLPRTAALKALRPKPKKGRNEPAFLSEVIATLADYRQESVETIAKASAENARRLFGLACS